MPKKYTVYVKYTNYKEPPLAVKHNLIDAIKVIRNDFTHGSRATYLVLEDDGLSTFPIILIQNEQDLLKLLEQYSSDLTKGGKSAKIKKK